MKNFIFCVVHYKSHELLIKPFLAHMFPFYITWKRQKTATQNFDQIKIAARSISLRCLYSDPDTISHVVLSLTLTMKYLADGRLFLIHGNYFFNYLSLTNWFILMSSTLTKVILLPSSKGLYIQGGRNIF